MDSNLLIIHMTSSMPSAGTSRMDAPSLSVTPALADGLHAKVGDAWSVADDRAGLVRDMLDEDVGALEVGAHELRRSDLSSQSFGASDEGATHCVLLRCRRDAKVDELDDEKLIKFEPAFSAKLKWTSVC